MSETMKVFVACAIGAFIGTVVSLEVNRYFWWFGLLAGGFVGYISYEFKKVVSAIPKTWRKAQGWQPDREWWREYTKFLFPMVNLVLVATFPISCLTVFLGSGSLEAAATIGSGGLYGLAIWLLIGMGEARSGSIETLRGIRATIKLPFFLKVYFWLLPKWTLKGGWWLLVVIARFVTCLFREIHSDIRILCGLDAAIGTVIGYFTGSTVIGAMAGGLWGALNFEILSIRILKLVPIEKSILR